MFFHVYNHILLHIYCHIYYISITIYMSNCIYLLWWTDDVADGRVWGIVGFTCKTRSKRDPGTPYIFHSGPTKIKATAPIVTYWYVHNLHSGIVCMINNLFSCDRKTLPVTFAAFIYNHCLTPPGAASAPKRHGDEEAAMIGRFLDFQNLNYETRD